MSLLDKASLIVTPNAYKESKLYSVVPNTTLGDMDVVRATTATRVNSAGLIEVVPRNLFTYSQDFTNAAWLKRANITIEANSIAAPNGTITASKLKVTDNNTVDYGCFQIVTSGTNRTLSVYAKKAELNYLFLGFNNDNANEGVFFDLNNGTISRNTGSFTASIQDIGDGWYRCSALFTNISYCFISPSVTGTSFVFNNQINKGIYIWGAQLENFATATEYFPTTTRLNIPRIDYTNGSCPSLLVEPQRTNFYPYSQQLNQWSILGTITVTENNEISPDGTQNADRAQFTASTDLLYRSGTGLAGSNTLTVYAKAKSGTSQKFRFFGNGGLTYSSDQVATNQWQRFTFTYTYSAQTAGLAGATTGASDVLFYGFQHEIGSYATSYIPTLGASSVTRNADVISKTGISSLIGQTEGTLFADFVYNGKFGSSSNSAMPISIDDASGNNEAYIFLNGNNNTAYAQFAVSAAFTCNITGLVMSIGTRYKMAFAYKQNDFAFYINGALQGVDTSGNILGFPNLRIANYQGQNYIHDNIKTAMLFKTRLSNSELAQLTTL